MCVVKVCKVKPKKVGETELLIKVSLYISIII